MTAARMIAEAADPGRDPAVARFVREAQEFCHLIESDGI